MANPNIYGVTPRDFLRAAVKVQSRMSKFTHEIIVHADLCEAKTHVGIIIRHDGEVVKTEKLAYTDEQLSLGGSYNVSNLSLQLELRAHELKTEAYRFIYIDEL